MKQIDDYRKVVEHNINKTYKKSAALQVIEEQFNACEFDELRDESLSNDKSLKLQYEIQLHKEQRDWKDQVKNIADMEVEKYKIKLMRDHLSNNLDAQKQDINIQRKIDKGDGHKDLDKLKCISKDLYDDV